MIRSSSVRERLWRFGGSGFVESGQTAQRWTPDGFRWPLSLHRTACVAL